MKFDIYMKSSRSGYEANAIYNDGEVTILKGSKIRITNNTYKKHKLCEEYRNDINYVENGILKKNITFKSPSTAAQFVLDQLINGTKCWKDKNGTKLKELIK